jgi:hypothetical protein
MEVRKKSPRFWPPPTDSMIDAKFARSFSGIAQNRTPSLRACLIDRSRDHSQTCQCIQFEMVKRSMLFHERHEAVCQAQQPGLAGLCVGGAGPRLGFSKFVFELVEDIFDIPSVL